MNDKQRQFSSVQFSLVRFGSAQFVKSFLSLLDASFFPFPFLAIGCEVVAKKSWPLGEWPTLLYC